MTGRSAPHPETRWFQPGWLSQILLKRAPPPGPGKLQQETTPPASEPGRGRIEDSGGAVAGLLETAAPPRSIARTCTDPMAKGIELRKVKVRTCTVQEMKTSLVSSGTAVHTGLPSDGGIA